MTWMVIPSIASGSAPSGRGTPGRRGTFATKPIAAARSAPDDDRWVRRFLRGVLVHPQVVDLLHPVADRFVGLLLVGRIGPELLVVRAAANERARLTARDHLRRRDVGLLERVLLALEKAGLA